MEISLTTFSPQETKFIASLFIKAVLKGCYLSLKGKEALVISLEGNLGAGKTEFMKGIGEALKIKHDVFSPTFLIMKKFLLKRKGILFKNLWHIDCYRLKNVREIENLGFQDLLKEKENIIFVEWGNKIKKILPQNYWQIKFKILGEKKRLITFKIPLKFYEKTSSY
jgi:tRNA threonylcarbamoyladenosine biosynthesis protein TsaE